MINYQARYDEVYKKWDAYYFDTVKLEIIPTCGSYWTKNEAMEAAKERFERQDRDRAQAAYMNKHNIRD